MTKTKETKSVKPAKKNSASKEKGKNSKGKKAPKTANPKGKNKASAPNKNAKSKAVSYEKHLIKLGVILPNGKQTDFEKRGWTFLEEGNTLTAKRGKKIITGTEKEVLAELRQWKYA